MTRHYKKSFKAVKAIYVNDNKGCGYKINGVKKYKFRQSHPGYKFSHLTELNHPTIPRISLPPDKLCPIEELELQITNPNEALIDKHEMYANMALLMFYPY